MSISKGYYLKARIIAEKDIAHASPHIREVWDYLLREANYKDKRYGKFFVKRGQLFRSYSEIREALHWKIGWRKESYSENQMKTAMRYLKKSLMITTTKTLGGVLITVINYDTYQNPQNYESTSGSTSESTCCAPMKTPSSSDNNKKDKELKNKEKFFPQNSVEFELSSLLLSNIRNHKPDFKEPNLQTWAESVDFMIRIDKRSSTKIREVIKWCQSDDFWRSNILSMYKLRKQFDALEIRMNSKNGTNRKQNGASYDPEFAALGDE